MAVITPPNTNYSVQVSETEIKWNVSYILSWNMNK